MTSFYKLSGGGNDFVALVEPPQAPDADSISAWCKRGISVGADGLFTVAREDGGVRMVHYNADGGRAELCLNGTRCAARLAFHLGWAEDRVEITTDVGSIEAGPAGKETVRLELDPPLAAAEPIDLGVGETTVAAWHLVVGGPHLVIPWKTDLGLAPVADQGPTLRTHALLGAAGANVHWVDYNHPEGLAIRSYERGVEAETLACGSGVLAAVAVGVQNGFLGLPVKAATRGGFVFEVSGLVLGDRVGQWALAGDARLVAQGELLDGARLSS